MTAMNLPQLREIARETRARGPGRSRACWRAIGAAATSGTSKASSPRVTARAGRLPAGVVYEATMRCNLHCEFCYVGTLLNIEGEWREELPLDVLAAGVPGRRRACRSASRAARSSCARTSWA